MIEYGNNQYEAHIPFDDTWKIEHFSLTPWPEQSIINAYVDATRLPSPNDFDASEGYLNDNDGGQMHGWATNSDGYNLLNEFDGGGGKATINFFITGTLQFGGGFGVGDFDVDLNPQLDSSFDPFSGIGSTQVGAERTNRIGIGIELNKKYCSIANSRLKGKSTVYNGNSLDMKHILKQNKYSKALF